MNSNNKLNENEFNTNSKKPPLPLNRMNSIGHRYSSWNRIHLNDLFSLGRSDSLSKMNEEKN